jgi:hypothetical protein
MNPYWKPSRYSVDDYVYWDDTDAHRETVERAQRLLCEYIDREIFDAKRADVETVRRSEPASSPARRAITFGDIK